MAKQNQSGGRGRGKGRAGKQPEETVDEPGNERNLYEIENQELRGRVDELQERNDDLQRRFVAMERQLAVALEALGRGREENEEEQREEEESEATTEEEADGNRFRVLGGPRNRRQEPRRNPQPVPNFGMKIEIPNFEGMVQPDEFINWLHTVERFFDLHEPTEVQKVKLVALKLSKHASIWWEHVKKQRSREGKTKIETWDKMKKLLQKKFMPVQYRQDAWVQYHEIKQGNQTVEQYTADFDRLRMRCDAVEEDQQTIARYLSGLRTEISDVVHLQQWLTYNDVYRLALKVEGQLKRKSATTRVQYRPVGYDSSDKAKTTPAGSTAKDGGVTSAAKSATTGAFRGSGGPRCFKCQGFGHMRADCPNNQLGALAVPKLEESGGEEEVVYADSGESLVIRRALNISAEEENFWLRSNIFHTKCTCRGKVCTVIIDGGSCENVVSTTMVDKLQLETVAHPQPYKLAWLKKGNDVRVTHKCLVRFSIGKNYTDEVWCDVIPMDACHLLLGRPWQFDRRVSHDGYKNTYTFKKDGLVITLGPTDLRKDSKSNLLSGEGLHGKAKVRGEAKRSLNLFAYIVREQREDSPAVPEKGGALIPREGPTVQAARWTGGEHKGRNARGKTNTRINRERKKVGSVKMMWIPKTTTVPTKTEHVVSTYKRKVGSGGELGTATRNSRGVATSQNSRSSFLQEGENDANSEPKPREMGTSLSQEGEDDANTEVASEEGCGLRAVASEEECGLAGCSKRRGVRAGG